MPEIKSKEHGTKSMKQGVRSGEYQTNLFFALCSVLSVLDFFPKIK
jgi:hypothetical protein